MILVSILGDFHSSILPISYEFKEKMHKHIIVYDDSGHDVRESWRILRGQNDFMKAYSTHSKDKYEVLSIQVQEDSYESINECFERIKEMTSNPKDIYLNATDGLSSIAVLLSSKFLSLGSKVIAYDKYANTYNLHHSTGINKYNIQHNMDIESHLMLKGYKLITVTDKSVLEQRKDVILKLSEDLHRFKTFSTLRQNQSVENIEGYEDYKSLLKSIGKLDNQVFVQGTVFEEYIYHLIVDNLDFDDVWMGVRIEFQENLENEFDILMIKNNHLHTIECKLVSGLQGEHYVYKTELIMEYLDDDGKAMILSIGGDNERTTKSGNKKVQFSLGDKARAHYGHIAIHQSKLFDQEKFLDEVREWFL